KVRCFPMASCSSCPAQYEPLPLNDICASLRFDSTPVFSKASALSSHFCPSETTATQLESTGSTHFPIITEGLGVSGWGAPFFFPAHPGPGGACSLLFFRKSAEENPFNPSRVGMQVLSEFLLATRLPRALCAKGHSPARRGGPLATSSKSDDPSIRPGCESRGKQRDRGISPRTAEYYQSADLTRIE